MRQSPLDKPTDIRTLRQLHADGLLSDEAYRQACRLLQPTTRWNTWAELNLLLIGTTLVLAGIIFFFAYNWSELDRFVKFGLIEASIVVCISGAFLRGLRSISGKALLLAASILVGVLLAVYGQVYQTGADAYELFRGWAILIAGWVLVSDFAALWIVWIALLNICGIQYWAQAGYANPFHGIVDGEWVWMMLAALNAAALILREAGLRWNRIWLSGTWVRIFLMIMLLIVISVPMILTIIDIESIQFGVKTVIVWSFAIISGYIVFRYRIPDIAAIAVIVMDICVILLVYIAKRLFHFRNFDSAGNYLLYFGIILLVITSAAYFLKHTNAKIEKERKETGNAP